MYCIIFLDSAAGMLEVSWRVMRPLQSLVLQGQKQDRGLSALYLSARPQLNPTVAQTLQKRRNREQGRRNVNQQAAAGRVSVDVTQFVWLPVCGEVMVRGSDILPHTCPEFPFPEMLDAIWYRYCKTNK